MSPYISDYVLGTFVVARLKNSSYKYKHEGLKFRELRPLDLHQYISSPIYTLEKSRQSRGFKSPSLFPTFLRTNSNGIARYLNNFYANNYLSRQLCALEWILERKTKGGLLDIRIPRKGTTNNMIYIRKKE